MTPLLLLPGMMCDARLFAPQVAACSAVRAVQVAALTGENSMSALARSVLATAPPRFALAGLSMGGIVAMEVVRQAPERVAGLALLDTNPLAEAEAVKAGRQPQLDAAREGRLLPMMKEKVFPNYLADNTDPNDILATCASMARALGPAVFLRQSEALMDRPDQTETLRRYKAPALILCGDDDRLCPPSRHHLMQELMPHARLQIIQNAGHLTTLEQPDATTDAITTWLEAI